MPDETTIDGEVVAIDEIGTPSFNLLQNFGSLKASLVYYVFDALTLAGRDVMNEPLSARRELLAREIMPSLLAINRREKSEASAFAQGV